MKLARLVVLTACAGRPPVASDSGSASAARDTRTSIETRRDAACEALAPKITQCAVDDAQADFAAGKITKLQLDQDTQPAIQTENSAGFLRKCKAPMSSRQVRVLEVCVREEVECGPLLSCLENLNPQ
jgi:hypothetical protein